MSYEGYVQMLCAAGHLRLRDVYETDPERCDCGQPFVFTHDVDETNCEPRPLTFTVAQPAEFEYCNLGHRHCVREATYVIPAEAK